jgi:hypothetical protein
MSKQRAPAKKKAGKSKPVTVYAVQRQICGYDEGRTDGEPERVFADQKAAEQYAEERALACRAFLNPFDNGAEAVRYIRGGEKALIALLRKIGLTPPSKKKGGYSIDWGDWWDETYSDMTDAQRDAIWNATSRLKLYRVVKTTLE